MTESVLSPPVLFNMECLLMVVCPHIQVSVVEVLDIMEAKGEGAAEATDQLERLLFIFHTLVSHRDGVKVTKPEAICQVRGKKFRHFITHK